VIINAPTQSGITVRVGKYLGKPLIHVAGVDHWEVDRSIGYGLSDLWFSQYTNSIDERFLLRIDGEEFEDEREEEKELVLVKSYSPKEWRELFQ